MFNLFLFSILILRGFGRDRRLVVTNDDLLENSGRVDALLDSLTKEQMVEIDEILQQRLITRKETEEEEDVDNFEILSNEHLSKEDLPPAVTNEGLSSLVNLGLSKADIEEVRELSKVRITSKETAEISNFIQRASDDELMEMSEMSPGDLEHLFEDQKSELKLKNSKPKHATRRDAEPDPEPETEPEPSPPSFYHSYGRRKKRSQRPPGFKLKLRAKLGFGKSKGRRSGSLLVNQRCRRKHQGGRGGVGLYGGSGGGGSYGRRKEHRGSYGVEYAGYWRRKREADVESSEEDDVAQVLKALELKQFSSKPGRLAAASLSHPRKKRFVMDTLMKMAGLKAEREEPPEVVYMSAVMGGKKHQVGTVEDSFHPDSSHHDTHHHGTPPDQQKAIPHPPAYYPSESYKLAMARAKLVRLH